MSDFLGRLVQRSLPTIDPTRSTAQLAPRLPALFEPTGGDVAAPFSEQRPASEAGPRPDTQNMHGPHRSVMPPTRTSSSSSQAASRPEPAIRKMSVASQNDEHANPGVVSPIRPSIVTSRVIHQEPEPTSAEGERQMVPLPPARLPADQHTATQTRRQSQRAENVAAIGGASQTTVRINIGRIEVRAVQNPQSVPPPRRAIQQAKLTIEEYAKQRNEGK